MSQMKSRIKVSFKYPDGDASHGYYDEYHGPDKESLTDAKGAAITNAMTDYAAAEWFKAEILWTVDKNGNKVQ